MKTMNADAEARVARSRAFADTLAEGYTAIELSRAQARYELYNVAVEERLRERGLAFDSRTGTAVLRRIR